MKITYFQLEAHLAKPLQPIYLISGEELILKQDAILQLRKKAKAENYLERVRITPETGYDWGSLHALLNSNSLFAEKRLIELDFREHTPPKLASQILQEYSNNLSPDILLLIDMGKVDDKIAKSAWYKALEKVGMVITIWPVTREQLPEWITKRAKRYKLSITPAASNLLADYVEGNLIAAAQAIEKLYLLKPNQDVSKETVLAIITDESHYTVFDLVEMFIAKDVARTLHILDVLKTEGTEPTLVIWAIARELRLLIAMLEQLKQGSHYDELWQRHRIFPKRQANLRRFLSQANLSLCLDLLATTGEIDKMIKGAVPGSPWNALQLLCLKGWQH